MAEPERCEECGLPIKACNALASYKYAIERVRQGNMISALEFADSAKTFHDAYLHEYRTSAVDNPRAPLQGPPAP